MSWKAKGLRLSCSTFDVAKILYEHLAEQVADDYSFTVGDAACRIIMLRKFYIRTKQWLIVCFTLHDLPEGSFLHLSFGSGAYAEELAYSGSLKKSVWMDFGGAYHFLNPVMAELRKYRIEEEPKSE